MTVAFRFPVLNFPFMRAKHALSHSDASIQRTADAVYLTIDAVRFRAHDACFGKPLATPRRYKVVALESPQSNTRYSVTAGGVRRACAPAIRCRFPKALRSRDRRGIFPPRPRQFLDWP
jgi:hypothetical protein